MGRIRFIYEGYIWISEFIIESFRVEVGVRVRVGDIGGWFLVGIGCI